MDQHRVRMAACIVAVAAAIGCGDANDKGIDDTASAMRMMDSTRDTATLNPTATPAPTPPPVDTLAPPPPPARP